MRGCYAGTEGAAWPDVQVRHGERGWGSRGREQATRTQMSRVGLGPAAHARGSDVSFTGAGDEA